MHGRVYDRSRIGLTKQRDIAIFLLTLVGNLLCFGLTAQAKSDYDIINTGIKGGGCWYDDSHFVVIQGHQPAPGQGFVVEGLYYLDPNQPKEPTQYAGGSTDSCNGSVYRADRPHLGSGD